MKRSLAQALVADRLARHMSIDDYARFLGYGRWRVRSWLNGQSVVSLSAATVLFSKLNLDPKTVELEDYLVYAEQMVLELDRLMDLYQFSATLTWRSPLQGHYFQLISIVVLDRLRTCAAKCAMGLYETEQAVIKFNPPQENFQLKLHVREGIPHFELTSLLEGKVAWSAPISNRTFKELHVLLSLQPEQRTRIFLTTKKRETLKRRSPKTITNVKIQ